MAVRVPPPSQIMILPGAKRKRN